MEKSLLNPLNYQPVSNLHPQLQNRLFYTLNFSKPFKLHHRAVLDGGFATVTMVLLQQQRF
jgi:hypothetical protein